MADAEQTTGRAPHDCYMDSCGASTMPGVACGDCCSCRGVCVQEGTSSDTEGGVSPATAGGASASTADLIAALAPITALARGFNQVVAVVAEQMRTEPDPRDAEIKRLRLEVASARSIADEKRAVAEQLRNQADEAIAERDSLRAELDSAQQSLVAISSERDDIFGTYEELVNNVTLRLAKALKASTDDNGLYELLAMAVRRIEGTARPPFEPGDRVRFGKYLGTVRLAGHKVRVKLDGTEVADYPTEFVHRLCNDKADDRRCTLEPGHDGEWHDDGNVCWPVVKPTEPRRWVAGEPEPGVGATVRRAQDGLVMVRRADGWHYEDCPSTCDSTGDLQWTEILDATHLVEVVSADG